MIGFSETTTAGMATRLISWLSATKMHTKGASFRQCGASVTANVNAIFLCSLFPTFFGYRPDTIVRTMKER
jgi:hypothetical protein